MNYQSFTEMMYKSGDTEPPQKTSHIVPELIQKCNVDKVNKINKHINTKNESCDNLSYLSKRVQENEQNKGPKMGDERLNGKRRIHIYAGSHGKNLYDTPSPLLPEDSELFICSNLGGTLEYVLSNAKKMTSDFTHDDVAVIIAGTNDVSEVTLRNRRPATRLPFILESFIESQAERDVFVVSQFRRYDIPFSNIIQEIIRVNKRLAQHKEINLINVKNFGRRLFTDHGLHLNRMGKKLLSKNIADSINNWFCNKSQLHNQNSNNENGIDYLKRKHLVITIHL